MEYLNKFITLYLDCRNFQHGVLCAGKPGGFSIQYDEIRKFCGVASLGDARIGDFIFYVADGLSPMLLSVRVDFGAGKFVHFFPKGCALFFPAALFFFPLTAEFSLALFGEFTLTGNAVSVFVQLEEKSPFPAAFTLCHSSTPFRIYYLQHSRKARSMQ
ncbi:MAG: hypothetical protein V8R96_03780 [Gemmiger sp.]